MSGASTLRNAVKRVTHKERAQPSDRRKLGLLEKHKDYVVRAKDFKNKKSLVKNLKKKASEKNPDEFYFKMINSTTKNGKHVDSNENGIIDDASLKLLKTQDLGYLIHKKSMEDSRVKKMRENLHFIGDNSGDKESRTRHTIFLDDPSAVEEFDVAKHFDTVPELAMMSHNRTSTKDIEKMAETKSFAANRQAIAKSVSAQYRELRLRERRAKKMDEAINQLTLQRNLAGKGSKRKIQADGKTVAYKWKRQRAK